MTAMSIDSMMEQAIQRIESLDGPERTDAIAAFIEGIEQGRWRAQIRARADRQARAVHSQERHDIHTAYNAMLELAMIPCGPVRVRSRAGMLALLESVFAHVPSNTKNRTYSQRRRAEQIKVRWSWPPEACARAHRARPLLGAA
jgi:hypothetical protein